MPVALPLIELGGLVVALICIGLALLIVDIMLVIARGFNSLPFPLNKIGDGMGWVAQAISGALGKAEAGVDSAIGASWHALSWFVREWLHMVEQEFSGILHLAELVGRLVYSHTGLKALVHAIERTVHGIEHGVKTLEREYHGIEHRVKTLEREIANGIGNDVRTGLAKVEKVVNGIKNGTIPALQRGIDGVSGELTQLENFIKAIPGVNYAEWAAGVVAAAVGLDILNMLRCPSFLNSAKNRGCNLWNGVEDMLGLLVDAVLIGSICEILPWLTAAVDDVGLGLVEAIHAAGISACSGTYPPPPPMPSVKLVAPMVYGTEL